MKTKLLILGSSGMVGSAVLKRFKKNKSYKIYNPPRKKLDLFNYKKIENYFRKIKPQIIILCAAKVGGILANDKYRADFMYENLTIQNNIIYLAYKFNIKKLIFLGSSCIYPRNSKQPIKEEYLLSGYLEKTNDSYAIAKIAGIKMIEAFNKQYGTKFISLMPTNIYGLNDNFHEENSHVVPALIKKIYSSYIKNEKSVRLWGTGKPLRDLLFSDDLAEAIYFITKNYPGSQMMNVGSGEEISIRNLSKIIAKIIGFKGKIIFDKRYPDGTPRKILDNSKIKKLGWKKKYSLKKGLKLTIDWYKHNFDKAKSI